MRHSFALAGMLLAVSGTTALAQQVDTPDVDPAYAAEVEAILADPRVRRGMDHIVSIEPQSRRDLIELTEIPAPPFGEEARAARFAEMLREAGLTDVRIDEVGNAIGRRPGTAGDRVVAYAAHLDTVFPIETDVTVRFDDERMYAPGIGDNTRGLVTVLGVLRAMQHAGIESEADIWFIGNVGEEGLGDLRGVTITPPDGQGMNERAVRQQVGRFDVPPGTRGMYARGWVSTTAPGGRVCRPIRHQDTSA